MILQRSIFCGLVLYFWGGYGIIQLLGLFFGLDKAIKYAIYVAVICLILAILKQLNIIGNLKDFIRLFSRLRIFKRLKHLEYENYYLMSNLRRIENIKELNKFVSEQEIEDLLVYYNKMGSFRMVRERLIKDKERQKVSK